MADTEMATNTNGSFDAVASYARLSERVENQGRDIVDLRSNMNTGFRNIEGSIKALADQLASGGKPQWQAIGVALTAVALIGALAYWPIREGTSDLKTAVAAIAENMVTREEIEWRSSRGAEDRKRNEDAIADLRSASVTRAEWTERNRARDIEVSDLSRRLEEIRQNVGAVYGTRDVIIDLKKEIDNLRAKLGDRGGPL